MPTAPASYLMLPNLLLGEGSRNGNVLRIPASVRTLSGFRRWVHADSFPEKLKAHFIQGNLFIDMSKESIQSHVLVKKAVYQKLPNLMDEEDLGQFYPDGVLVTNIAAGVSNNPDGVAVLWQSFASGRVRYQSNEDKDLEIQGTPDWVMEIISDSSVTKDKILLRRTYHKARIPEYWLIDARGDELEFNILHWRRRAYSAAVVTEDGWQHSEVFGHEFRLSRLRNRMGDWQYKLEVK
jgi:Uma2 family endonuclease